MDDVEQLHTPDERAERLKRRAFAIRAHEIEGNPLDADDIALLEHFDRLGLTDEQRIAAVIEEARKTTRG